MNTSEMDLILDSEFNNAGDLIGLDTELNGGEMLGKLRSLSPLKRFQVLNKLTRKPMLSKGSRRDMEKHFKSLPKRVRAELASGKMRLGDWSAYSVKKVSSQTVKLFETQDDQEISISNVSNAKLPKNSVLMVSWIQLVAGEAPATGTNPPTIEQIKATDFKSISTYPALANANWSLKANKVQIVPEHASCRRFVTDNNQTINLGTYFLDNPRPIQDDVLLEFVIELGSMFNLPDNLHVRVEFGGSVTAP